MKKYKYYLVVLVGFALVACVAFDISSQFWLSVWGVGILTALIGTFLQISEGDSFFKPKNVPKEGVIPRAHEFLHNHPNTESMFRMDKNHVIVDRKDWELAKLSQPTDILPKVSDMENKLADARVHQKNEPDGFVEGYRLGYTHCYNWIGRLVKMFNH